MHSLDLHTTVAEWESEIGLFDLSRAKINQPARCDYHCTREFIVYRGSVMHYGFGLMLFDNMRHLLIGRENVVKFRSN